MSLDDEYVRTLADVSLSVNHRLAAPSADKVSVSLIGRCNHPDFKS